jgi:hypothetical protein
MHLQGLLRQLDAWMAKSGTPYLGGDAPNAADCYLVPKLKHAEVALGALKGWQMPGAVHLWACIASHVINVHGGNCASHGPGLNQSCKCKRCCAWHSLGSCRQSGDRIAWHRVPQLIYRTMP